MTTQEGNKLIAEFMGVPCPPVNEIGYYTPDELEYHSSWDWLMPACKKWDDLPIKTQRNEYNDLCDELEDAITRNYDVYEAWEQLVKNIQWYNENKDK